MSIRLAPACNPARSAGRNAGASGLLNRVRVMAANDDHAVPGTQGADGTAFDPVLVDALRHFARHGLDAARVAHAEAERERLAGNGAGAAHWVAITGMFDRRLAAASSVLREPA